MSLWEAGGISGTLPTQFGRLTARQDDDLGPAASFSGTSCRANRPASRRVAAGSTQPGCEPRPHAARGDCAASTAPDNALTGTARSRDAAPCRGTGASGGPASSSCVYNRRYSRAASARFYRPSRGGGHDEEAACRLSDGSARALAGARQRSRRRRCDAGAASEDGGGRSGRLSTTSPAMIRRPPPPPPAASRFLGRLDVQSAARSPVAATSAR